MTTSNDILSHIMKLCPNATLGDDSDGQIIIYTNMKEPKYDGRPSLMSCIEMNKTHQCSTTPGMYYTIRNTMSGDEQLICNVCGKEIK